MNEQKVETYEREVRTLRDWIVPSTLFIAAALSIVLYVFTISDRGASGFFSAAFAVVSMSCFIASLFLVFGALGEVEMDSHTQEVPAAWFHHVYTFSIVGVLTFVISLSLLCFSKSLWLGIIAIVSGLLCVLIPYRLGTSINAK